MENGAPLTNILFENVGRNVIYAEINKFLGGKCVVYRPAVDFYAVLFQKRNTIFVQNGADAVDFEIVFKHEIYGLFVYLAG